ncbi:hypothetical protein HDU93_006902, partial [Gonapodya sp. JEL0774]
KRESHLMVADQVKRELDNANAANLRITVDDTDGIDAAAEYAEWKLRHLKRLLRDKEERDNYAKEQEELERRRNMTEAERETEDMAKIAAQKEAEKNRTKYRFLQKYYHKGAFYQHTEDEVYQRDYDEAVGEDRVDKVALPEVMQVRNFGMKGRTKWTHLGAEDTSKGAVWGKGMGRGRGGGGGGGGRGVSAVPSGFSGASGRGAGSSIPDKGECQWGLFDHLVIIQYLSTPRPLLCK